MSHLVHARMRRCAVGPLLTLTLAIACGMGSGLTSQAHASKVIGGFIGGAPTSQLGQDGQDGALFNQPRDIAVYTGNDADPANDKIFVTEATGTSVLLGSSRVQRFDGAGNFERAWGKDVTIAGAASDTGAAFEVCVVAADCKKGEFGEEYGEFRHASGIAVDQDNGWVYVLDRSNFRIQKFDLDGNFIAMFGKGVNVGPGNPDICTSTAPNDCGVGTAGAGAGQFANIAFNAASSAPYPRLDVNPATGDVFAVDPGNGAGGNRRVLQFTSAGVFVRAWGWNVNSSPGTTAFEVCTTTCQAATAGTANGQLANNPQHIAVGADGIVYVGDANSGAQANRIVRFDSDLAPADPASDASGALLTQLTVGTPPPGGSTQTLPDGATQGLEIDRSTHNLVITRDPTSPTSANTVLTELSAPAAVPTVADTHVFANQPTTGLGLNSSTGVAYLAVALASSTFSACGPSCHGAMMLIENGGVPPVASISPPPAAGSHTATLEGTVDPNGSTRYRFEISKDGVTWTPAGGELFINGYDQVTVTQQVTGLEANTFYRVRLVAFKYTGLTNLATDTSAELIFATDAAPPDVTTLAASSRRTTSASLQGLINPNGSLTTYYFEYGPTDTYGQQVPVPAAVAGTGGVEKVISQQLGGLVPATVYHYRLVAENSHGVTVGADLTFTTRSSVEAPAGRAYEIVSQRDKVTGPGLGGHGNNSELGGELGLIVGTPSEDGERFVSRTEAGAVLTGGAAVYVSNSDLSERTADGWAVRSAWNRPNYGSSLAPFLEPRAASDDLSLMMFGNRGGYSQLFPEQADWPTNVPYYLRDWNDRWRLIAPTDEAGVGEVNTFAAIAGNGSRMTFASLGRGMLGSEDPTNDLVVGARAAYVVDVPGPLSDTFGDPDAVVDPNRGPTALLAACTGSGSSRTLVPEVLAGKLVATPCSETPVAERDAVLTSPLRGAGVVAVPPGENAAAGASTESVVSVDGARTFFMSPDPTVSGATTSCSGEGVDTCPPQIYVRQVDGDGNATVRWLSRSTVADQDASLAGVPGQEGNGAYYEGASHDGDKVFFRTNAPLTADDLNAKPLTPVDPRPITTGSASNSSWDLYLYDLPDGVSDDPADGTLTRVSAGPLGTGDCNVSAQSTSDALRYVSDSGDRAYFTCAQPLPGVPAPANGTITVPDGTAATTDYVNLYFYDASKPLAERWRFVARLPRGTAGSGPIAACATTAAGQGGGMRNASTIGQGLVVAGGRTCVRGNGEGTFISFWTEGRLLGTDPEGSVVDMYGYDADADELVRLSAPQGGSGGTYTCLTSGNVQCHGDPGFVGAVNEKTRQTVVRDPVAGEKVAYFESRSRLVADDSDDEMDVYEWRDGNLSLVSTGIDDAGAYESGVSATGRDVFFTTRAALTWQDIDAVMDAYDARVGGGFEAPPPPAVCAVLAGACQGPAPPATTTDPRSNASGGGGNASPGARPFLTVITPSGRSRRIAARTGTLEVAVQTSAAGRVSARAVARLRGRSRVVASGSRRARRPGRVVIKLRLSPSARRFLRAGRPLRLRIRVADSNAARPSLVSVTLREAGR